MTATSIFVKSKCFIRSSCCDKFLRVNQCTNVRFSDSIKKEDIILVEQTDSPSREETELNIEKLRNKSRLSLEHRNILFNEKPYSESKMEHHLTIKYNRRMYGIYGSASGVNPGIMWPTKTDIAETREYENVAYPKNIQELISAAKEENKANELREQEIHKKVVEKMLKLNSWKEQLNIKLIKKEAEALAAKEKKERLMEEVRRHFGFKINPKDARFQEVLLKKEKEQKKLERQARLAKREKEAIAKLMEQHKETE